jgi:peptide/nickel transport system ATP-binding protein
MNAHPNVAPIVSAPLLRVRDLAISFALREGPVHAVRGISFDIAAGDVLALVGESGSGKSVTALALLGLIQPPGRIIGGTMEWKGRSFSAADAGSLAALRGRGIGIVFQDPMISLNPLLTVGFQISETVRKHLALTRRQAQARTADLLSLVGISNPRERMGQFPWQLSGGMRQRVMIAMALSGEPELLIADEPTTALDVTIQRQVIDLLRDLQDRLSLAVLFISHDLGVVSAISKRMAVMYAGRIVEIGTTASLFRNPSHPYLAALLRSTPRIESATGVLVSIPGTPPNMRRLVRGCAFADRCPEVFAPCHVEDPLLIASQRTAYAVACLARAQRGAA